MVGTGRCGSTLLSNIVRAHPKLLSLSEVFMSLGTRAFSRRRLSGRAFWRILSVATPGTRIVSRPEHLPGEFLYTSSATSAFTLETVPPLLFVCLPHLTDEAETVYFELEAEICARPTAPIGDHYRFLFERLGDRFAKPTWVERSGGSLSFLPSLIAHFPEARFVHLARDGRDVALSIARHPGMRLFTRLWRLCKDVGVDFLERPFLFASNRPAEMLDRVFGRFVPFEALIEKPLPLRVAGEFWSEMIRIGLAHWRELDPARRLDMRYEDLVARPRETLTRFARFLGPDYVDGAWLTGAGAMARPRPSRWRHLPADERAALQAACAPGLKLLGYR